MLHIKTVISDSFFTLRQIIRIGIFFSVKHVAYIIHAETDEHPIRLLCQNVKFNAFHSLFGTAAGNSAVDHPDGMTGMIQGIYLLKIHEVIPGMGNAGGEKDDFLIVFEVDRKKFVFTHLFAKL